MVSKRLISEQRWAAAKVRKLFPKLRYKRDYPGCLHDWRQTSVDVWFWVSRLRYLQINGMSDQTRQIERSSLARRSQRISLSAPVIARSQTNNSPLFCEETRTLVVNAHGALISLTTKVGPGQRLVLQNALSGEEQECRVVYLSKKWVGMREIGIAFTRPAPNFWKISFPPDDWKLLSHQG